MSNLGKRSRELFEGIINVIKAAFVPEEPNIELHTLQYTSTKHAGNKGLTFQEIREVFARCQKALEELRPEERIPLKKSICAIFPTYITLYVENSIDAISTTDIIKPADAMVLFLNQFFAFLLSIKTQEPVDDSYVKLSTLMRFTGINGVLESVEQEAVEDAYTYITKEVYYIHPKASHNMRVVEADGFSRNRLSRMRQKQKTIARVATAICSIATLAHDALVIKDFSAFTEIIHLLNYFPLVLQGIVTAHNQRLGSDDREFSRDLMLVVYHLHYFHLRRFILLPTENTYNTWFVIGLTFITGLGELVNLAAADSDRVKSVLKMPWARTAMVCILLAAELALAWYYWEGSFYPDPFAQNIVDWRKVSEDAKNVKNMHTLVEYKAYLEYYNSWYLLVYDAGLEGGRSIVSAFLHTAGLGDGTIAAERSRTITSAVPETRSTGLSMNSKMLWLGAILIHGLGLCKVSTSFNHTLENAIRVYENSTSNIYADINSTCSSIVQGNSTKPAFLIFNSTSPSFQLNWNLNESVTITGGTINPKDGSYEFLEQVYAICNKPYESKTKSPPIQESFKGVIKEPRLFDSLHKLTSQMYKLEAKSYMRQIMIVYGLIYTPEFKEIPETGLFRTPAWSSSQIDAIIDLQESIIKWDVDQKKFVPTLELFLKKPTDESSWIWRYIFPKLEALYDGAFQGISAGAVNLILLGVFSSIFSMIKPICDFALKVATFLTPRSTSNQKSKTIADIPQVEFGVLTYFQVLTKPAVIYYAIPGSGGSVILLISVLYTFYLMQYDPMSIEEEWLRFLHEIGVIPKKWFQDNKLTDKLRIKNRPRTVPQRVKNFFTSI